MGFCVEGQLHLLHPHLCPLLDLLDDTARPVPGVGHDHTSARAGGRGEGREGMPLGERGRRDGEAGEAVDWGWGREADGVRGEDVGGEGVAVEVEPGVED